MRQGPLQIWGAAVLTVAGLSFGISPAVGQARVGAGKLAGVVGDVSGTPQMGASVQLLPESTPANGRDFFTNTQGVFHGEHLAPGLYTVRVTLAGFLPTIEQHVRISAHVTTVVRIQLESIFASLDQLRRQPAAISTETDDWKWVLRSASITRPVLEWDDSAVLLSSGPDSGVVRPKALLEFTDGARRPGSASNLPATPATSFAYDQKLWGQGRLLVSGEMNYLQDSPGGGIATVWLPKGSGQDGPSTELVIREAKLGPDGPVFRGVRMRQDGSFALGTRSVLSYSGEYVMVGLLKSASSIRPRVELDTQITTNWHTALIFAAQPDAPDSFAQQLDGSGVALASAMQDLDSLPTLLTRNGQAVLENGWHEELAVSRNVGSRGNFEMAAFHDDDGNVALFGRGTGLPSNEYLQDYFSNGFAYDGGSSHSWGTRVALREKLTDNVDIAAIYAFAGALGPGAFMDSPLRNLLRMEMYHSAGVNVSAKIPRSHSRVEAGYKWISGDAVSRVDGYGESLYQMDPFFHVSLRQELPKFGPGRWEAIADCDNLFAQGYVPMTSQDGRASLIPVFRSFRGGLSVQF